MTLIIKPQEIEQYVYLYNEAEKPVPCVIQFFIELRKRQLLSSIELIPYGLHPSHENILFLYPNGVTYWNHPMLSSQNLNECLNLIKQNQQIEITKICLCPHFIYAHEERKRQLVLEGLTIGQYAMEVKRMERLENSTLRISDNWHHTFEELKQQKINSALDRYNIQFGMYEEFGDKGYLKRMNRWLRILKSLAQM